MCFVRETLAVATDDLKKLIGGVVGRSMASSVRLRFGKHIVPETAVSCNFFFCLILLSRKRKSCIWVRQLAFCWIVLYH
ncbi:hypothetical protein Hanom_Chr09g00801761 [Helianthus anomalus]